MIEPIKKHKEKLRSELIKKRRLMLHDDVVSKSRDIFVKLKALECFITAKELFIYIDHHNEVMTRDIIQYAFEKGIRVYVPRVEGKRIMNFYEIYSLDDLVLSKMEILEPVGLKDKAYPVESSLMLMPGVAYDGDRNRVGYGGGYYDRYLSMYPCEKKVALAYDFQIVDGITSDEFDIRPDIVITEKSLIV